MTGSAGNTLLKLLLSASATLASVTPVTAQTPEEASRLDAIDDLVAQSVAEASMNQELASKLQLQTQVIRKEFGEGDRAEAVAKIHELSGNMVDEGLSKQWVGFGRANEIYYRAADLLQTMHARFHFDSQILYLRTSVNSYAGSGEIATEFAKTLRGELIVLRDEMRAHDLAEVDSKAAALSNSTLPQAASQGALSSSAHENLTSQLEYIRYAIFYVHPCDEAYRWAVRLDDGIAHGGVAEYQFDRPVVGRSVMIVNNTPSNSGVDGITLLNNFVRSKLAITVEASAPGTEAKTIMTDGASNERRGQALRRCAELHTYVEIVANGIVGGVSIRVPIVENPDANQVFGPVPPFRATPVVGRQIGDAQNEDDEYGSIAWGYKWELRETIQNTLSMLIKDAGPEGSGNPGSKIAGQSAGIPQTVRVWVRAAWTEVPGFACPDHTGRPYGDHINREIPVRPQ